MGMHWLQRFWQDEEGATVTEYAILAALITGAIAGAVALLGTKVNTSYSSVMSGFK